MSSVLLNRMQVTPTFQDAAVKHTYAAKPRAAPFSLRLTVEERKYLEQLAGNKSLGRYIRDQLLGDKAFKRRHLRKPKVNDKQVAALLAGIGRSNVPNNLNQLARAVNMGTLDVSDDVDQQLKDACSAVLAMRRALFIALGLKPEDYP